MNTIKTILVAVMLCLLFGCQNNPQKIELQKAREEIVSLEALQGDQNKLQNEIEQLHLDNANLERELKLLRMTEEKDLRMDLRSTINLSFKIFSAMQNSDYDYLTSVSAPNLKIDKKEKKIIYDYDGRSIEFSFLRSLDFNNLEYWSHTYLEENNGFERFEVGFAQFWKENGGGHSAFYMSFSKVDGQWLLDGIIS